MSETLTDLAVNEVKLNRLARAVADAAVAHEDAKIAYLASLSSEQILDGGSGDSLNAVVGSYEDFTEAKLAYRAAKGAK